MTTATETFREFRAHAVPESLHERARVVAAKRDMSLSQLIIAAVTDFVARDSQPQSKRDRATA